MYLCKSSGLQILEILNISKLSDSKTTKISDVCAIAIMSIGNLVYIEDIELEVVERVFIFKKSGLWILAVIKVSS
jgi:hypothetical protein